MLFNVVEPAILISREGSWATCVQYPGQILLSAMIGIQFFTGVSPMGHGTLALGVLGASVGFGMSQGMQIVDGQILGFLSGESCSHRPLAGRSRYSSDGQQVAKMTREAAPMVCGGSRGSPSRSRARSAGCARPAMAGTWRRPPPPQPPAALAPTCCGSGPEMRTRRPRHRQHDHEKRRRHGGWSPGGVETRPARSPQAVGMGQW
jgi:hypothetical protein